MSLEIVLIAPVVFVALMLLAGATRFSAAEGQVEHSTWDAARAASLASVSGAQARGVETARSALSDRGIECTDLTVVIDTSNMTPGGTVTADVSCTADLSDLTVPGVPGSRTLRAHAVVPIEPYRG